MVSLIIVCVFINLSFCNYCKSHRFVNAPCFESLQATYAVMSRAPFDQSGLCSSLLVVVIVIALPVVMVVLFTYFGNEVGKRGGSISVKLLDVPAPDEELDDDNNDDSSAARSFFFLAEPVVVVVLFIILGQSTRLSEVSAPDDHDDENDDDDNANLQN